MRKLHRLLVAGGLVGMVAVRDATSAFADHEHALITPGTTVTNIARGNVGRCADEPAGHKFHENVHTGQPGAAFSNPANRVSVVKTENATC